MKESLGIDFDAIIKTASELLSQWGMKVVGALVLLVVGFIVIKVIRRSVRKALVKAKVDEVLTPFISNMVYYVLLSVLLIAVLGLFGVETTSVIAVLGAAGLAVGLALQGTLSNFASGVMLLIFRPFKIGDFVDVAGAVGVVDEVGVFSTKLNTPDNVSITVPNSTIYGQMIKNYSSNENRRIDLVMGISYDDDIGKAITTIQNVLDSHPAVLTDPAPTIAVSELADSSVNLVVRPWVKGADYWSVRFELTRSLKEQLEAAGLSIPYPQQDVHVFSTGKAA